MMSISTTYFLKGRGTIVMMIGIVLLLFCQFKVNGQTKPPRPIAVSFNPGEGLRFGAFFQSTSGGTVIISTSGLRTFTGSVVGAGLGIAYGPADFEIDADPGTLINLLNGPDATLYGSSGGTMTLHLGTTFPSAPFITTVSPPAQTSVKIGGTLTVGSPVANPSGTYSGSFVVTFIQE